MKRPSNNLPHKKRLGKILREDYWSILPEEKEEYLKDIAPDEITRFVNLIKNQPVNAPELRLPEMTSGLFFNCCRLGYEASSYEGIEKLSAKELYRKHADGRDEGLLSLDESSAEAFEAWCHDKTHFGGHPWEVCRGGNSTHISLYVKHDEKGWWLRLAGSSLSRSVETVKFYLALMDNNMPVFLTDGMEVNMEEYFMDEAKCEFQKEIDAILNTIKEQMILELNECPNICFRWDDSNNTMNASAKSMGSDEYLITVNLYTPWSLKKNLLWGKLETECVNAEREFIVHSFISHILSFIVWHEYYHIAFGHCTIPKYQGEFNERISVDDGSFRRQQFEAMCDICASRKFAADIFILYEQTKDQELFHWLFAILYIYFLECEKNQIKRNTGKILISDIITENRTHPFLTIRFDYVCDILDEEIKRVAAFSDTGIDSIHKGAFEKLHAIACFDSGFEIDPNNPTTIKYKKQLLNLTDLDALLIDTKKVYIKL